MGDIQINAMPPWAHLQGNNPFLPSNAKDNLGHAPHRSKGRRFGPTYKSQAVIMFTKARKDAFVDTPSSLEP